MSHIEENINYSDEIIATDRDKLISMLDEYSTKLNRNIILQERNRQERVRTASMYILILLLCSVVVSVFLVYSLSNHPELIDEYTKALTSWWISLVSLVLGVLALYYSRPVSSVKNNLPHDNGKNTSGIYPETSETSDYTYDVRSLAYRLEKLVGMASQFYEHVETNQVDKMDLDFKLAAAESVLKHYESAIGQPKNPKSGGVVE